MASRKNNVSIRLRAGPGTAPDRGCGVAQPQRAGKERRAPTSLSSSRSETKPNKTEVFSISSGYNEVFGGAGGEANSAAKLSLRN